MKDKSAKMKTCELLERKLSVFKRYLSVTLEMKQVLERDPDDGLDPLISKRQRCINTINTIDRDLDGIGGKLRSGIEKVSSKVMERIGRYINRIEAVIKTITPLERELVTLASMESDTREAALLKLRQTRKATEGYGGHDGGRARFLDMKS